MKSKITRKLLNIIIKLHRKVLTGEYIALNKATDRAYANVEMQKRVLAAERGRLEDLRLTAAQAEDAANLAWKAADAELAQFPARP